MLKYKLWRITRHTVDRGGSFASGAIAVNIEHTTTCRRARVEDKSKLQCWDKEREKREKRKHKFVKIFRFFSYLEALYREA